MSSIKCALTSDNHFNVARRSDEAKRILRLMLEDWKARDADFIGFAGDLVDGPMTAQDFLWLCEYVQDCANVAPVGIAYGNHCPRWSLHPLSRLKAKYPIIVEGAADVHPVDTKAGKIAIAAVAFPWKAEILARIGNVNVEDTDRVAEEALRQVFLGMGVKVRELGLPTIGLVHAAIRGSKLSDDQPARPLGLEIPAEDLAQIGASFYAVGHVHAKNEFEFNGVNIWTPTSPFFTDYGEAKHEKGYIWCELSTDRELIPVLQRIPTPVTPMLLLENWWEFQPDLADMGESDFGWRFALAVDPRNADIRFRFHYAKDQEKVAKSFAEDYARSLRVDGAVSVTLDPVVDPAIRSRIPELTTATTLEKKAELYRESTNAVVGDDERKILDQMVQEIQEELAQEGVSFGIQSRAVPTLKRLRGKGWLCFPDEFDIDVSALGDLTALVAPNESGKTLFMSLAGPGLLYGDTPNRGSLDDLSRARDAFIEGTFDMDSVEYTLGQVSNAMVKTNKGHVNLTSGGKPVLQKAGRREYSEWSDKHLLPWNQYLSLLFHSGSEDDGGRKINIIDMKDGARTELMLKVLGIEFYESIAQKARDKAKAVSTELERVNARLSELGQDDLEHLSEVVSDYRNALETEQGNLVAAETELTSQRASARAIEIQRTERDALIQKQAELQAQEQRLREKIADIETRIANNQQVVDQAETIRAAHIERDSLGQHLDHCEEWDRELNLAAAKIENVLDLADSGLKSQEAAKNNLIKEISSLNAIYATKTSVQATIASIPEFEKAVVECVADRDGALKEYEEVQAQAIAGKDERIVGLRTGLEHIRDGEDVTLGPNIAATVLEDDERTEKMAADHPALLRQAKAAWQQRDLRAKEATEQLASLQREAEKLPSILKAGERAADLEEEVRACEKEIDAIHTNIEAKCAEMAEVSQKIDKNKATAKEVSIEIEKLKPLADKLSILESAETRIAELTIQRGEAQTDLDSVVIKLELIVLPDVPDPLSLTSYESVVASTQKAVQQCQSGLVLAEKALSDAQAKEQRVQELLTQATRLRTALDRWNRIAREFGVDGLQKEEISNAGESLTSIVNELLRAGGDMDHTVDIRTERPHSRENRMIPCFEILITDSRIDGGAPKEARRLSGYGQTVIGKALAMAMTRLGCERAGIRSCTIWFDELCGTATPDNAIRIIGMVRHFADSLNAKIFFVDQDPDIQALADSRINILDGGRIEVN